MTSKLEVVGQHGFRDLIPPAAVHSGPCGQPFRIVRELPLVHPRAKEQAHPRAKLLGRESLAENQLVRDEDAQVRKSAAHARSFRCDPGLHPHDRSVTRLAMTG
jgi:hypothetical protein